MKIKFYKAENGQFHSGIYTGHGGISSLVWARQSSFFSALSLLFRIKVWKAFFKARKYRKNNM